MFVGIQKREPNQRSPHNRRNAFWQLIRARLIVEVVSPGCTTVTRRLVLNEPLKQTFLIRRPSLLASRFVKSNKAARQKTHALAGLLPADSKTESYVHWEPPYPSRQ